MLLYRAMIVDASGMPHFAERPLVVPTARGLGVRDGEIEVDDNGDVVPETGGPSVALFDPRNLVVHRRPPSVGGTGRDPGWEVDDYALGEMIVCRIDPDDPDRHGFLEPIRPMALSEYQEALTETRDAWRKWE